MSDLDFETAVEIIRISAGGEDDARLTQGEAASLINRQWGDLKRAAIESHVEYKSLAERRRIVEFYGASSAGQTIGIGQSFARRLLDDNPTLRWTHLRVAKGLGDFEEAYEALEQAAESGMTPQEFKRWVALKRRANGHVPRRHVFDLRAGWKAVIWKPE